MAAYSAGWTGTGATSRHHDRILDAELDRALADPDSLGGIAQLTARWAAAVVLDLTASRAQGAPQRVHAASSPTPPPTATNALRAAVRELIRPMLSPALAAMHRDAFIGDKTVTSTVNLAEHRANSILDGLALDQEPRTT